MKKGRLRLKGQLNQFEEPPEHELIAGIAFLKKMDVLRTSCRVSKCPNAQKRRTPPKSKGTRSKRNKLNFSGTNPLNFETRSMKKKEYLQSDWPEVGKSHMVFIESSLDNAPPIPYRIGYRFKAQVHTPEEKLPATWKCCPFGVEEWPLNHTPDLYVEKIQHYLRCPPLPGLIGEDSIELEIQGWIRVGNEKGAQLFTVCPSKISAQQNTCSVKDIPQSGLVAKVYDPIYISSGYLHEGFHCVDEWYTSETNTYRALIDLQGVGIPRYYGSYSLSIPLPQKNFSEATPSREVRLILIELVKGITMSEFSEPKYLPQQVRKNILRALIDLESQIYQRGINIGTLKSRNVILKEPIDGITKSKVVIVDFERAFNRRDVKRPVTDTSLENCTIPRPRRFACPYISPILRWGRQPHSFADWIDWEWNPWLEEEFRHAARGITPELRK